MSNPYESSSAASPEEEVEDVRHPVIATIAGFVLMAAGLFSAASGAQLVTLVTVYSWWAWLFPPLILLLGVAAMVIGGTLARGRFWAAVAGSALAGFMGIAGLGWVIWACLGGFFAPLGVIAALFSMLAATLSPLAIMPCRRYSAARARLYV